VTDAEIALTSFDVALAINLKSPGRYRQEIVWLKVVAENMHAAADVAREYALSAGEEFEATGLVRRSFPTPPRIFADNIILPIFWNTPVLSGTAPASPVRDSSTLLRIGFVANAQARERLLPPEYAHDFTLLTDKPTASSRVIGLSPTVWQVHSANKNSSMRCASAIKP
jgi:hypothetical protein